MELNRDLISPCGLYCGVCAVRIAHMHDNQKFKDKLAPVYWVKPEEIRCTGCMSSNVEEIFPYCRMCPIKTCTTEKGYEGCYQCDDFPCEHLENFPIPAGKQVILKAISKWRELGTVEWVRQEEARYVCPECGHRLFRGAGRCNSCKTAVTLD